MDSSVVGHEHEAYYFILEIKLLLGFSGVRIRVRSGVWWNN